MKQKVCLVFARTTSMWNPAPFHHAGTKVVGAHSLEEMVGKLKKPRRVMMLVKAGSAVDAFIDKLVSTPEESTSIEHKALTDFAGEN